MPIATSPSPVVADFVEQTSATTGTGAYALGAVAPGHRAFSSAFANGELISYVATNGVDYECGFGCLNGSGTLERSIVTSSSNANSPVDWGAGTKRVYCAPHSGSVRHSLNRNNYAAGGFPMSGDNEAAGYGLGAVWEIGGAVFEHHGAGVWRRRVIDAGASTVLNDAGIINARSDGSVRTGSGSNSQKVQLAGAEQARHFVNSIASEVATGRGTLAGTTSDGSGVELGAPGGGTIGIAVNEKGAFLLRAMVLAYDVATGTTKAFEVRAMAKRYSSTTSLVFNTVTVLYGETGTTGWTLSVSAAHSSDFGSYIALFFDAGAGNTDTIHAVAQYDVATVLDLDGGLGGGF